jgi:hypothetical protein
MFTTAAHLRSVTLELKLNRITTADASPCLPRLLQASWQKFFKSTT